MSEADCVCACDYWMRDVCKGLRLFREIEGKPYCVLHCPVKDKIDLFREALKTKLEAKDFDFRGVFFPEIADFRGIKFSFDDNSDLPAFSSEASFSSATFSSYALFSETIFSSYADFRSTTFNDFADFRAVCS